MKIETENAIRSILSLDPEVSQENLEKAVHILWGRVESEDDLVHVLRFKEVMNLLHVHRRTLEYYIDKGYLDRVYGRGERALGISRDSYIRFTTERRVVRNRQKRKGSDSSLHADVSLRMATAFEPNNQNRNQRKG